MQMQNRVVLVTGGARGIGRGVCMVMAERGADTIAADLNLEGAQAVAGELERFGHRTGAFRVDVTVRSEIDEMVAGVIERFGRIDVLVNAAGVIGAPGFEDTTRSREEDWDITFDVNVKGTALTSDAVAAHMKERRSGKIVNIASQAGRGGGGGGGAYGASKAAVIHLTQSYALDLAPYDINVNVICPGSLWTPMWERIAERSRRNQPALAHLTPRQIFEKAIRERLPPGTRADPRGHRQGGGLPGLRRRRQHHGPIPKRQRRHTNGLDEGNCLLATCASQSTSRRRYRRCLT